MDRTESGIHKRIRVLCGAVGDDPEQITAVPASITSYKTDLISITREDGGRIMLYVLQPFVGIWRVWYFRVTLSRLR